MNEFTAKKLAEVEAFCKLSGVIVQRASGEFSEKYSSVAKVLHKISEQGVSGAIDGKLGEVFGTKLEKTIDKLTRMMELYIGDEWGNPVEVLEWCSFFTGAGAAHAALASELEASVQDQLDTTRKHFEDALQEVITGLRGVGIERKT